jgi:hypothetical protein
VFELSGFASYWLSTVLFAAAIADLIGFGITAALYLRSRWRRPPDRLAHLAHIVAPIPIPRTLTPGSIGTYAVWFFIGLALWMLFTILSAIELVLAPSPQSEFDFVLWSGLFLVSQMSFGLSMYSVWKLRPVLRRLSRRIEQREAEAKFD